MYYLHKFCVICLKNEKKLKNLFQTDDNGISYYEKLITSISEMGYKELNEHTSICYTCCESIQKIYNFRKNCLKSKTILSSYISTLSINNNKECDKLYVRLNDYKRDLKPKRLYVKLSRINRNNQDYFDRDGEFSRYNCELLYKGIEPKPVLSRVYFSNIKINNLDVLNLFDNKPCQHLTQIEKYNDYDGRSSEDSNVTIQDVATSSSSEDSNGIPQDIVRMYFEGDGDHGVIKYEKSSLFRDCSVVLEKIRVEDYIWENTYVDENLEDALWPEEESNKQQLEIKFSCYVCYKKYYKECGLFSHMISHLRRTPYVCSICHHRFPTNVHLDKHFNTHQINEKSGYFCHLCKCEIPDLETFTTHTQTHKDQPPKEEENAVVVEEKPTDENKTNENPKSYDESKTNIDESLKPCDENVKTSFDATTSYDVPNADDNSCNVLDENAVGDSGENGDSTKAPDGTKPEVEKKAKKKEKKGDHVCDLCSKVFLSDSELDQHLMLVHKEINGERPIYKCRWCTLTFYSDYSLKEHETQHTGENNYTCSFCPKAFTTKYRVIVHERIHKGIFPYECSACHRKYHDKYEVKRHLRKGRCKGPQNGRNATAVPSSEFSEIIEVGDNNETTPDGVVKKKKKSKPKKPKDGSILKGLLDKETKEQDELITPMLDLIEQMHEINEALPTPELNKSDQVDVEIVPDMTLLTDDDFDDDNLDEPTECPSDVEAYFPEDDIYDFNDEDESEEHKQDSATNYTAVDNFDDHTYVASIERRPPKKSNKTSQLDGDNLIFNFDVPNDSVTDEIQNYSMNRPSIYGPMRKPSKSKTKPDGYDEPMLFSNIPQYMAYANKHKTAEENMKQTGMYQKPFPSEMLDYSHRSLTKAYRKQPGYAPYGNRPMTGHMDESKLRFNYPEFRKAQSQFMNSPSETSDIKSPPIGYSNRSTPTYTEPLDYGTKQGYPTPSPSTSYDNPQETMENAYRMNYGESREYRSMQYPNKPMYPSESSYNIDYSDPMYMGYNRMESNMYGMKPESSSYVQSSGYDQSYGQPSSYGTYPTSSYSQMRYDQRYNHSPTQYSHSPTPGSSYNHPGSPSYAQSSSVNYNRTNQGLPPYPQTIPPPPYGQSASNYPNIPTHSAYTNQPSPNTYMSRSNMNPYPQPYANKQTPTFTNYQQSYQKSVENQYNSIKNIIRANFNKYSSVPKFNSNLKYSSELQKYNSDLQKYNSDLQKYNSNLQKMNSDQSKFDPELPKFNPELPKFNPEQQKFNSDLPKFNSEQQKFNSDLPKFNPEQQKFNSDLPKFNSDQQKFNADQQKFNADQQKFNAEQQKYNTEQQTYNAERQKFNAEQPKFNAEQPKFNSNVPKFNPEQQKFNSDLPKFNPDIQKFNSEFSKYNSTNLPKSNPDVSKFGSERPKFGSERSKFGSERPKFGSEGPKFGSERPKFGSERSKFGSEGPKFGSERPKFDSEGPKFNSDLQKYNSDIQKYNSDLQKYSSDLQKYNFNLQKYNPDLQKYSDLPKYDTDPSKYDTDLPKYDTDLRKYDSDLPKYDSDLPKYDTDLPKYDSDLPKYDSNLPKYDSDLPKYDSDLSKFTSNIQNMATLTKLTNNSYNEYNTQNQTDYDKPTYFSSDET